jgi:hypothetical protein
VLKDPAVQVELFDVSPLGPVLLVRVFVVGALFDNTQFAINQAIRDEVAKAGYPVPAQHYFMQKAG